MSRACDYFSTLGIFRTSSFLKFLRLLYSFEYLLCSFLFLSSVECFTVSVNYFGSSRLYSELLSLEPDHVGVNPEPLRVAIRGILLIAAFLSLEWAIRSCRLRLDLLVSMVSKVFELELDRNISLIRKSTSSFTIVLILLSKRKSYLSTIKCNAFFMPMAILLFIRSSSSRRETSVELLSVLKMSDVSNVFRLKQFCYIPESLIYLLFLINFYDFQSNI